MVFHTVTKGFTPCCPVAAREPSAEQAKERMESVWCVKKDCTLDAALTVTHRVEHTYTILPSAVYRTLRNERKKKKFGLV